MPHQGAWILAVANVAVGVVLSGCAAAAPPLTAPAPSPTAAVAITASPTTPPSPSVVQTPSEPPTPSPTPGAIVVVMNGGDTPTGPNLFFLPQSIKVTAGAISFSLNNQGDHPHGMSIATELYGKPLASIIVPPHTVAPFVVEGLAPGAYTFWSPVGDDAKFGMVGKLTVSP